MMFQAALVAAGAAAVAAKIEFPAMIGRGLLEMTFEELPFPQGDLQHEVATSGSVEVDGTDYAIKYQPIVRSGDKVGDSYFGWLTDKDGEGIMLEGEKHISNGADYTSLIPEGDYVCMITHLESPDPGTTYLSTLTQGEDGKLTMMKTEPMDWSAYDGLWVPCAGSVTPWKTHLGGEEYEPDARVLADLASDTPDGAEWLEERIASWGLYYLGLPETLTNAEAFEMLHPYFYGYPWEAKVGSDSTGCNIMHKKKHMAMGRMAIELPYVMPDKKTVYITDDGTNTMLGMYVMSEAGDLSCGSLYAAKMTQTDAAYGGTFDVEFVEVGEEACDSDFEGVAASTTFFNMFEAADIDEVDGSCPEGFVSLNAQPGGAECLRMIPGMEKLASRFEFRRVASMMGATTEFSKMEGITLDHVRSKLYVAMSEVKEGMEDNGDQGEASTEFDLGGPNHLTLEYNECGCVYTLDVDPETYMATKMYALICGDKEENTDEFNTCNKEVVAQPDNIAYVTGHDGLIIGEDASAAHQNDAMWYHDFATGTTTRMLSTPYGSETTSPYFYPNINNYSYMTSVVQHPYGESDEDRVDDAESTGEAAWVGYVGPFMARSDTVDMASEMAGWQGWPTGMYGSD